MSTRLPCVPLQEPDTSAYDAFLEQLAEDTKQYVIAVFKTLTATVPKAIIHAQVGPTDPAPSSSHAMHLLLGLEAFMSLTQLRYPPGCKAARISAPWFYRLLDALHHRLTLAHLPRCRSSSRRSTCWSGSSRMCTTWSRRSWSTCWRRTRRSRRSAPPRR